MAKEKNPNLKTTYIIRFIFKDYTLDSCELYTKKDCWKYIHGFIKNSHQSELDYPSYTFDMQHIEIEKIITNTEYDLIEKKEIEYIYEF